MTETQRSRTPTRLLDVDALRGFALFGILVVNLAYFASGYPFHLVADPAHGSWRDDSVEFGVRLLFEMKFYLLFSFLFGYSFTLQLAAAGTAGANFTARFVRRVGGLFVLGGLHAVLLFQGDILTTYALLGLGLPCTGSSREPRSSPRARSSVSSRSGWPWLRWPALKWSRTRTPRSPTVARRPMRWPVAWVR
ncbi:DUF418 domain-containing protein [Streptomyces sp. enrichment culture]|uniref:DUF418 domain-containing protein n=1 Tax=Streptomyces sp. enrichment culture TaxID=1795815 RepID=UPI003F5697B5